MDQLIPYDSKADRNGWRRTVGIVNVPIIARRMVVHYGDNLEPNSGETVCFDTIKVYKLVLDR